MHEKMADGYAEETHAYHVIREKLRHKLRHPGLALDLKTKDFIGRDQTLLFISQFRCVSCTVFHSFL